MSTVHFWHNINLFLIHNMHEEQNIIVSLIGQELIFYWTCINSPGQDLPIWLFTNLFLLVILHTTRPTNEVKLKPNPNPGKQFSSIRIPPPSPLFLIVGDRNLLVSRWFSPLLDALIAICLCPVFCGIQAFYQSCLNLGWQALYFRINRCPCRK